MSGVAFVDCETTGLDPDQHAIWEVGCIVDGEERQWFLPVDLGRADAFALKVGHFHERYEPGLAVSPRLFAEEFAALTRGRHLVGAVVSFDEERLRKLLRANGACPEWHYHLIDVEALAVGYLLGDGSDDGFSVSLPWKSDDISRACGVEPPGPEERHTALGDARWVKRLYEAATTTTPGSRAEAPEARVEVGGELEGTAAGGRTDHPTPAAGASSSAEEDTDWIGWGPLADAIRTIVRDAHVVNVGSEAPTTLVYVGHLPEPAADAFRAFAARVRWVRR